MTEYLILTALMAIASIAVVKVFSGTLQAKIAVMASALSGHVQHLDGPTLEKKDYQARDMGDFEAGLVKEQDGL